MTQFAYNQLYHDTKVNDAWLEANENKEPCPYCPSDKPMMVHRNNWEKHMRLYHSEMLEPLNYTEARSFQTYEAVIGRGLEMFYAVGDALAKIRDGRLYREQYGTFAEYCEKRWKMTRQRGYQLIQASEVAVNLDCKPMVDTTLNERQARELASLSPDEQRVVWEVVKQTAPKGKVTTQHVKSVKKVLKEVVVTHAIDDGTGEQIPVIAPVLKAAVIEETYERMQRQEIHIDESNARKEAKLAASYTPPAETPTDEPTEPLFSFEIVGKTEPFTLIIRAVGLTELEVATLQTRLQTPIAKFRKDRATGKINKAELEDPTQELQAS